MAYFQKFPFMAYAVNNDNQYKLVRNLLKRVKLRANIKSGLFLFDKYDVIEGEKPEDVAFKIYGDAEYHWVILMTNDIKDRYFEWPMSQPQFHQYLEDKYGVGESDSIHHYEISQTSGPTTSSGPEDYSYLVQVNSDEAGATAITNREYEQRIQDQKRQIRILDKRYLTQFVEEFEKLLQE